MTDITHKALRDSENPGSWHIREAFGLLVTPHLESDDGWPLAFSIDDIVEKLVEMAHTDEEGIVSRPAPIVRRTMKADFTNQLTNRSIFQIGYREYELKSSLPFIPVTKFFFANPVQINEEIDEYVVKQSLPKKPHMAKRDSDGDYLTDDSGAIVISGEVAGVIVFQPNCPPNAILRAWALRRAKSASGSMASTVRLLDHARPGIAAVKDLEQQVKNLRPAITKALPRPA
jgi:hypothetical protein